MNFEKQYFASKLVQPETINLSCAKVVAFSHPCPNINQDNEDAAWVYEENSTAVLAIADGAGGYPNGEWASQTALEVLEANIKHRDDKEFSHAIMDGILKANQVLLHTSPSPATTMLVAEINGKSVRPYHVGDSMLIVTSNRGQIKWQTLSHSPTGYALEAGLLSEVEAINHEERHLVSNLVGSQDMRIEMGPAIELNKRDTVLLASDGLFDTLAPEQIIQTIRKGKLDAAAQHLSTLTLELMNESNSKPDDLTFLLYRRT